MIRCSAMDDTVSCHALINYSIPHCKVLIGVKSDYPLNFALYYIALYKNKFYYTFIRYCIVLYSITCSCATKDFAFNDFSSLFIFFNLNDTDLIWWYMIFFNRIFPFLMYFLIFATFLSLSYIVILFLSHHFSSLLITPLLSTSFKCSVTNKFLIDGRNLSNNAFKIVSN